MVIRSCHFKHWRLVFSMGLSGLGTKALASLEETVERFFMGYLQKGSQCILTSPVPGTQIP